MVLKGMFKLGSDKGLEEHNELGFLMEMILGPGAMTKRDARHTIKLQSKYIKENIWSSSMFSIRYDLFGCKIHCKQLVH